MYLEIVELLVPHLRDGAVVVADNIESGGEDEQPYAKWIRDPAHGFVSSSIVMKGGTEYSVWVSGTGVSGTKVSGSMQHSPLHAVVGDNRLDIDRRLL